jgi:hypothetical protein
VLRGREPPSAVNLAFSSLVLRVVTRSPRVTAFSARFDCGLGMKSSMVIFGFRFMRLLMRVLVSGLVG